MAQHEQTYWWHLGRLQIIDTYLKKALPEHTPSIRKILNVGCGTGGTVTLLKNHGAVTNVDTSAQAINYMKQQGHQDAIQVNGIALPFSDEAFDIVGAFDVLEHIADDAAALQEWRRVLTHGGAVVLTVPAYAWLWSDHDVSLHHKRRYTWHGLSTLARQNGFTVERISYAFVFSLPLVAGFRLLHKISGRSAGNSTYVDLPAWLNRLFTRLLYIEAWAHRYVRFACGTSVVAILRKHDG